MPADRNDLTRVLGPISDHTAIEILRFRPRLADIEAAAMRLSHEDDALSAEHQPLSGVAARIYDIVARDPVYLEGDNSSMKAAP